MCTALLCTASHRYGGRGGGGERGDLHDFLSAGRVGELLGERRVGLSELLHLERELLYVRARVSQLLLQHALGLARVTHRSHLHGLRGRLQRHAQCSFSPPLYIHMSIPVQYSTVNQT